MNFVEHRHATNAAGRDGKAALARLVSGTHLVVHGELFGRLNNGFFNFRRHAVAMVGFAPRLLAKGLNATFLVCLLDVVKVLTRYAQCPACLGDVLEQFAQLESSQLGSNELVGLGHGYLSFG